MRRFVLAAFALAFLAACLSTATELTEEQEAEIIATIDTLTDEWWDAWEVIDFERGMSFIHDNPSMTWTGAGRTVYSVAEAREVWGPLLAGLERQVLDVTNARTVILAPDIVWTLREFDFQVVDTTGAVVSEGQSIETAVWVEIDGEWKLMVGHDDNATPYQ
jgi:hypothetical protein